MKKILNLICTAFVLSGLFVMPTGVGAISERDQYQMDEVGGNGIAGHQYVGQSFKPTKNRLNKVRFKLKGAGDAVFAQMTKTGNSALLLPGGPLVVTTVDASFKWYEMTFSDVAVTPGESYTIWLATNGGSFWGIHTAADETYADGIAYIDCATWVSNGSCDHWIPTADWAFETYGYSTETPPPPAAPPAAPPTSANTAPKTTPTTVTTLEAPVLTGVQKNGGVVPLPLKDPVSITQGGTLSLSGTSTAGAEVSLKLGEKTYPATTAADGTWKIELLPKDLKAAEYAITGKTVKDGKSSAEKELLKIKVVESAKSENATIVGGWASWISLPFVLAIAGILTILLVVLVVLVIRQSRHHAKLAKEAGVDINTSKEKPEKK